MGFDQFQGNERIVAALRRMLERDRANLREELVQVAAVAVAWLEAL